MRKLTENVGNGEYAVHNVRLNDVILKLGQLEDIEQELGIDLVTLFDALLKGIHVNVKGEISFVEKPWLRTDTRPYTIDYWTALAHLHIRCLLADYGKTWALTKEELTESKGAPLDLDQNQYSYLHKPNDYEFEEDKEKEN